MSPETGPKQGWFRQPMLRSSARVEYKVTHGCGALEERRDWQLRANCFDTPDCFCTKILSRGHFMGMGFILARQPVTESLPCLSAILVLALGHSASTLNVPAAKAAWICARGPSRALFCLRMSSLGEGVQYLLLYSLFISVGQRRLGVSFHGSRFR